jgi:hypothetical protein
MASAPLSVAARLHLGVHSPGGYSSRSSFADLGVYPCREWLIDSDGLPPAW